MPSFPPVPPYTMERTKNAPFDPPAQLTELRAEQPITRVTVWNGKLSPWLVTRWEDAREVLSHPALSVRRDLPGAPNFRESTGHVPPGFFIGLDDPGHAVLRRALAKEFIIKRVNAMRPMIARLTDELITGMTDQPGPADFVEQFALPLPSLVICELLGVPYEQHAFFQEMAKGVVDFNATAEEVGRSVAALIDYLRGLVQTKRAEPGDDLVTRLAAQAGAGVITEAEAAGLGVFLLIAGHETTANMISLSTVTLLQRPELIPQILGEPDAVATAVEELLRYLAIMHSGLRRTATEDVTIGDVTIRAGEGVIVPVHVASRDPEIFDAPDELDLARANARKHLAFGYGVHQCLGQPLARAELQIVLPELFRRLPGLKIAVPVEDIAFKQDTVFYGVRDLPVTW